MQDRATRTQMLDVGSVVGEYKIEKLVGQGGMGQVYGAVHPVIGKRAAIKVLRGELCSDPEAIDRFVLEARAVNQIGHPNIVDVFAFGALPDGRQYMVMEWLRGESLDQRIRRMLPTLDEACDILLGICAALDAAHAEHIIHRDLKPHNVFLSHARGMKPAVKLLDFGLVKLTGEEGIERTRSGSMLGTPAYMSPEQARGRGVDHRTDLYALGVMMFELATGTLPFVEQSAMEMVMAHLQFAPPAPSAYRPDLPPLMDQLILGLLEKDPAQRPTLAYTINALTEVRRLVTDAVPVQRTGPAAPTLIPGHPPRAIAAPPMPPGIMTPAPMVAPNALTAASVPASRASTPVPYPSSVVPMQPSAPMSVVPMQPSAPLSEMPMQPPAAPSGMPMQPPEPTSVAPTFDVGSSAQTPELAVASTPGVPQMAPARTGRRVVLALVGAVLVAAIAFGVVMAIRTGEPAAAWTPDAAPVVTPAVPDAAVARVVDAAVVAPVVDAPIVEPVAVDATAPASTGRKPPRPKPRTDAGVAAPADAGVVAPADAPQKPFDDGDGLLPMKGGSR